MPQHRPPPSSQHRRRFLSRCSPPSGVSSLCGSSSSPSQSQHGRFALHGLGMLRLDLDGSRQITFRHASTQQCRARDVEHGVIGSIDRGVGIPGLQSEMRTPDRLLALMDERCRKRIKLHNGIPSRATFRRKLGRVKIIPLYRWWRIYVDSTAYGRCAEGQARFQGEFVSVSDTNMPPIRIRCRGRDHGRSAGSVCEILDKMWRCPRAAPQAPRGNSRPIQGGVA